MVDTVESLADGEDNEEDGSSEGEESPGAPEVGVDEISTPHVPALAAVIVDTAVHVIETALWIKHHVLGQSVEELGHGLVTSQRVLDDAFGVQQAHVLGRVNDVVHEEDVGRHLVPSVGVEPLECHEVEEHEFGGVVHDDDWE